MGNARAIILDFQYGWRCHAQNHIATHWGVGHRIVHQVAQQFMQQRRFTV